MFLTQNISARTKMPACQHLFPLTRSQYGHFDICQPMTYRRLDTLEKIFFCCSTTMCMQNFITIFRSVQVIGPFSLFQNLELGKASNNKNCHFAISWARSCQYQCLRNSLSNYSTQFKRYGHFHFFRIWRAAKPRPMINVILQFLELDLVKINVSAKLYQNIPNGLRVKFHCFQNLNLG